MESRLLLKMTYSVKEIYEDVKKKFEGKKRWNHILGVKDLALKLGKLYNLDLEKIEIAALLHDYAKYDSLEEQIVAINDQAIVEKFKDAKEIYHAFAAANICQSKFGITDPTIIDMIRYHVYGRLNMNIYEKILVVADYAEENRTYDSCIKCRNILEKDGFYQGLYFCIDSMIQYLERQGIKPFEEQYLIREEIKGDLNRMELLKLVKEALDKVNAYDIKIYDLRGISPLADFTVIASIDVIRQANGVVNYIEEKRQEYPDLKIRGIEGRETTWILVDFYDVILHVFTKDERMNFDLDKLYLNVPQIDLNLIK